MSLDFNLYGAVDLGEKSGELTRFYVFQGDLAGNALKLLAAHGIDKLFMEVNNQPCSEALLELKVRRDYIHYLTCPRTDAEHRTCMIVIEVLDQLIEKIEQYPKALFEIY